jgi:hypothetical protein
MHGPRGGVLDLIRADCGPASITGSGSKDSVKYFLIIPSDQNFFFKQKARFPTIFQKIPKFLRKKFSRFFGKNDDLV